MGPNSLTLLLSRPVYIYTSRNIYTHTSYFFNGLLLYILYCEMLYSPSMTYCGHLFDSAEIDIAISFCLLVETKLRSTVQKYCIS